MPRNHRLAPTWRIVSFVLLVLACASTPASRIEKQQALFDTYPAEVQSKIRDGKVDIGFDPDMVRLALGDPDETSIEVGENGETLMWGYTRSRPGVSVGVGGGGFGGDVGMGAGVGMGSGPRREYIAIVEFREGRVTNVRYFDR